jgi:hypothetical protein
MLYSVIFKGLTGDDLQTIGKRINPPVLAKIGAMLDAQETREAINSLTAINNEALVIDLDTVDDAALIDTLHAYRVQRPETRIIIYAPGRCPGDLVLAQLVALGIYDLVTPDETPAEGLGEIIVQALDAPAGTYASASRFSKTYVGQGAAPAGKGTPGKSNANGRTVYVAHQLIAVWSPTGYLLAFTALNLAALAASKGFDTALINYDLNCPDLDYWFGVRQTGLGNFDDASAGVMTFDDSFRPELVARFLKERAFGVKYLPAGNKLGKIGAPEIKDAKMAGALGAWLGLGVLPVIIIACVLGLVWSNIRSQRGNQLKPRMAMFYYRFLYGMHGRPLSMLPEDGTVPLPPRALPFGVCLAAGAWV